MISASLVKELREQTGAGMMDCKKALAECDGNLEAAVEEATEDLTSKTLTELKAIAKEDGIKGYSTMKKDELIASLSE